MPDSFASSLISLNQSVSHIPGPPPRLAPPHPPRIFLFSTKSLQMISIADSRLSISSRGMFPHPPTPLLYFCFPQNPCRLFRGHAHPGISGSVGEAFSRHPPGTPTPPFYCVTVKLWCREPLKAVTSECRSRFARAWTSKTWRHCSFSSSHRRPGTTLQRRQSLGVRTRFRCHRPALAHQSGTPQGRSLPPRTLPARPARRRHLHRQHAHRPRAHAQLHRALSRQKRRRHRTRPRTTKPTTRCATSTSSAPTTEPPPPAC